MWEKVKLGELATFINGYAFKPSDWSSEGHEIIRIQNLTKSSSETNYYKGQLDSKYKITKGDILISWSATLGVYTWNKSDGWLNQHIFKVVFNKKEINKSFFIYLIQYVLDDLKSQVHGATMKHITKGNFDNTLVPLPPLPIQEKIATILDKADELRRKDKDLQAKYDELAQAIFIDMFGDPVRNEKGWEVKNGINVLSILGGNAFKSSSYVNAGIPLLRIGSVNKGYYDKSQQVYISESSNFDKYKIYPNDLLVTLTGTVGKDDYGNICMIGHDFPFYYLNQRVAKITTDLNKTYLMYLLKQKEIKKELIGVSRGVRQANIGNNDFYKLNLPVPPLHLQQSFAKKTELINQLKAQTNAQKSQELFQSLLQKAFKGELVS